MLNQELHLNYYYSSLTLTHRGVCKIRLQDARMPVLTATHQIQLTSPGPCSTPTSPHSCDSDAVHGFQFQSTGST